MDEAERPNEGLDDNGLEEVRAKDGVAEEGATAVDHWGSEGAQEDCRCIGEWALSGGSKLGEVVTNRVADADA